MATPTKKKLYKINTFDYGVKYRYASNAVAAKNRVVFEIFGKGYTGWDHDHWQVVEIDPSTKKEVTP